MYNEKDEIATAGGISAFSRRCHDRVWDCLRSVPSLSGLNFAPSRAKGVHLSAYVGANAAHIQALAEKELGRHVEDGLSVQCLNGFVNLTFPNRLLWQWIDELLREASPPAGWEEESHMPDFHPIPYACNRLRMECFALRHLPALGDRAGVANEEGIHGLFWPLFALGFWPEAQRERTLAEGAERVSRYLERQRLHDPRLANLWTAWAMTLMGG